MLPIETWAGVGLAPRRDIRVPGYLRNRIALLQRTGQGRQRSVLNGGKRDLVATLQLYTNRIIVAPAPALPAGFSSMPRALSAWDKLDGFAIPAYEKVS